MMWPFRKKPKPVRKFRIKIYTSYPIPLVFSYETPEEAWVVINRMIKESERYSWVEEGIAKINMDNVQWMVVKEHYAD